MIKCICRNLTEQEMLLMSREELEETAQCGSCLDELEEE